MDGTIGEFFTGRSVLLTGGTGFVGKVTIEKLLRSCPTIDTIYLLIRDRKDQNAAERAVGLMAEGVFGEARRLQPGCEAKIKAIHGDISLPGLGMSDADREEICRRVTVVFHIAATVKFTEELRVAAAMNIVAVKSMVELATSLDRCDCFVQCSTAYAHTYLPRCGEELYDATFCPDKLLKLLDLVDDDKLIAEMTPALIKPHPNTYTFTKCLGEHVVNTQLGDIPVAVVRPAIVTPAWQHPYPGWTDTPNGPAGITLAIGAGLLSSVPSCPEASPALVPVDVVASYLIAAAWHTHSAALRADEGPTRTVYNCVGGENMTTWGQFCVGVNRCWKATPMEKAVRSPQNEMIAPDTRVGQTLARFWGFVHDELPAKAIDLAAKASGRRPFAARVHRKTSTIMREYQPWLTRTWDWEIDQAAVVTQAMAKEDRAAFTVSVAEMEWPKYMDNFVMGLKRFVLKEEDCTNPLRLEAARKNQQLLQWKDFAVRLTTTAALWRFAMALGLVKGASSKTSAAAWLAMYTELAKRMRTWSVKALNTARAIAPATEQAV